MLIATGHFRNGILLTPVTSDCIAELITSGRTPGVIRDFTPARLSAEDLQ
jgi:glycine/D-amino acid oxidase-like deaminating enzyme